MHCRCTFNDYFSLGLTFCQISKYLAFSLVSRYERHISPLVPTMISRSKSNFPDLQCFQLSTWNLSWVPCCILQLAVKFGWIYSRELECVSSWNSNQIVWASHLCIRASWSDFRFILLEYCVHMISSMNGQNFENKKQSN